uniref:VWFA domain-containing protein n=1 Tax=Haemonchus contortus TaxID=6289 RepID=A0A7I4YG09_HAECO
MEATTAMSPAGITSATDYVVSAFSKLTIGQAEQYQTRFGVIRYASSVDLIADLNVYTSTADLFDLTISSLNETGTNIEGAIRLATSKFASASHRPAARPVLIIVGSTYESGGYNDPTQAAREFHEDGGNNH